MKKLIATLVFAIACMAMQAQQATFDWTNPGSLTPAFKAPNADNRYGEYISNVEFTGGENGSIHLVIDDNSVKEQSQRARFLYGYNTRTVEMRAYTNSTISIWSTDKAITRITFTGPKADESYLEYTGKEGTFKGGVWEGRADSNVRIDFYVMATINCFTTDVVATEAGVDNISVDAADAATTWYTISGLRLSERPATPGLYICRGTKATKVIIR